jgi:hypothetical protein
MAAFVSSRNAPQLRILNDANVTGSPIRPDFVGLGRPAAALTSR